MTLQTALESLKPLKDYDKLVVQEKLNSGFTLVCADKKRISDRIQVCI